MDNTFSNSSSLSSSPLSNYGFSLIELMVAIAVVSILSAIALPSMNDLLVKMRVDNEISEMQRLLLTARNTAINTGKFTTVCPLVGGVCKKRWHRKISVFTNDANTVANGKSFTGADELVKIKETIETGDKLEFADTSVIFSPSGRMVSPNLNRTFKYCPKGQPNSSRGIDLSVSGRSYATSDTDNDNKDEDRSGSEITCST